MQPKKRASPMSVTQLNYNGALTTILKIPTITVSQLFGFQKQFFIIY